MNRVVVPARQATQPGGIGFLESILGLLRSLKIRALSPETGIFYFRSCVVKTSFGHIPSIEQSQRDVFISVI
jgi:hypothetical protein